MNRKRRYRDLDKWAKVTRAQKKRYYDMSVGKENEYQPWTENEVKIVMEHKKPDREISDEIKRSVRAIQIMRSRVKNKMRSVDDA